MDRCELPVDSGGARCALDRGHTGMHISACATYGCSSYFGHQGPHVRDGTCTKCGSTLSIDGKCDACIVKAILPKSTNPKDAFGITKADITKVPPIALLHLAHAMMNGAHKYGAYNWRQSEVSATIYVAAALRHLLLWFMGEEKAKDSGVHHLGHAMACCAIPLDAMTCGKLVDDRPKSPEALAAVEQLMEAITASVKEWKK